MVIFTTLKPMDGPRATIQRNAVKSWTLLEPRPEIVVYGVQEARVKAMAWELGVRAEPIERGPEGVPLVSKMFERGFSEGPAAYVNGDIILTQSFIDGFVACQARFRDFLMMGIRHDVQVDVELPFNPGWEKLWKSRSTPYSVGAIDYFAANRNIWGEIPDFSVGRYGWDNWLVGQITKNTEIDAVDVSQAVLVFHQSHGDRATREMPESKRNIELMGKTIGLIPHARWHMRKDFSIERRR